MPERLTELELEVERLRKTIQQMQIEKSREDLLRFEYEAVTARHYSRESSTLTICTLTTAAALALLAITAEAAQSVPDLRIYAMGLLFAVGGIAFHEVTVFTIDRVTLDWILPKEDPVVGFFPEKAPEVGRLWRSGRWFVFRAMMWTPLAGFLRYLFFVPVDDFVFFTCFIGVPAVVFTSAGEYVRYQIREKVKKSRHGNLDTEA